MNERIKEFVERAEIKLIMTEFTGCLKGKDYLVTDCNLSEYQLDKFAELIIKQCISIVNIWSEETPCSDGYDILPIHKIKEYFGIKIPK